MKRFGDLLWILVNVNFIAAVIALGVFLTLIAK